MRTIAIIQARMNSTRLPGKVLMKISGKTILEHVVRRVLQSKLINEVMVATTTNKADLKIVELCKCLRLHVFCGQENDVLDRYYQAAKKYHADNIVRITADCPLIDPKIIDAVIKKHLFEDADYTANILHPTYPDGLDVEVFTFSTLEKTWKDAKLLSEREHVTPFIIKHPQLFKQKEVRCEKDFSDKRWTLDNDEDLKFIKIIYDHFYEKNKYFKTAEIIRFLEKNPSTEKINLNIKRNEGYTKSLRQDKVVK